MRIQALRKPVSQRKANKKTNKPQNVACLDEKEFRDGKALNIKTRHDAIQPQKETTATTDQKSSVISGPATKNILQKAADFQLPDHHDSFTNNPF